MSFASPGYLKAHSRNHTGQRTLAAHCVTIHSGNRHQGKKEKYPSLPVQARYCLFFHVLGGQYVETGCCYYEVHDQIEKSNNKRMVTVRRVIILLNFSRHPSLICLC
jgi:hypothetical protein